MIFDTDVLIWALRGKEKAGEAVQADPFRSVSVISSLELLQGARSGSDLSIIRELLARFEIIPVTEEISFRAGIYMEEHALKGGLGAFDALIGATAVEVGRKLCSGNAKHYRQIDGLELVAFRP